MSTRKPRILTKQERAVKDAMDALARGQGWLNRARESLNYAQELAAKSDNRTASLKPTAKRRK